MWIHADSGEQKIPRENFARDFMWSQRPDLNG